MATLSSSNAAELESAFGSAVSGDIIQLTASVTAASGGGFDTLLTAAPGITFDTGGNNVSGYRWLFNCGMNTTVVRGGGTIDISGVSPHSGYGGVVLRDGQVRWYDVEVTGAVNATGLEAGNSVTVAAITAPVVAEFWRTEISGAGSDCLSAKAASQTFGEASSLRAFDCYLHDPGTSDINHNAFTTHDWVDAAMFGGRLYAGASDTRTVNLQNTNQGRLDLFGVDVDTRGTTSTSPSTVTGMVGCRWRGTRISVEQHEGGDPGLCAFNEVELYDRLGTPGAGEDSFLGHIERVGLSYFIGNVVRRAEGQTGVAYGIYGKGDGRNNVVAHNLMEGFSGVGEWGSYFRGDADHTVFNNTVIDSWGCFRFNDPSPNGVRRFFNNATKNCSDFGLLLSGGVLNFSGHNVMEAFSGGSATATDVTGTAEVDWLGRPIVGGNCSGLDGGEERDTQIGFSLLDWSARRAIDGDTNAGRMAAWTEGIIEALKPLRNRFSVESLSDAALVRIRSAMALALPGDTVPQPGSIDATQGNLTSVNSTAVTGPDDLKGLTPAQSAELTATNLAADTAVARATEARDAANAAASAAGIVTTYPSDTDTIQGQTGTAGADLRLVIFGSDAIAGEQGAVYRATPAPEAYVAFDGTVPAGSKLAMTETAAGIFSLAGTVPAFIDRTAPRIIRVWNEDLGDWDGDQIQYEPGIASAATIDPIYFARVEWSRSNTQDIYTVQWFKDDQEVAGTAPTISARTQAAGLFAGETPAADGTGWTYTTTTNRVPAGSAITIDVTATIDGQARTHTEKRAYIQG